MKKIFILTILVLLLCGCEDKECIKSHTENSVCNDIICLPNGNTLACHIITTPCTEQICDKYEED